MSFADQDKFDGGISGLGMTLLHFNHLSFASPPRRVTLKTKLTGDLNQKLSTASNNHSFLRILQLNNSMKRIAKKKHKTTIHNS